MLPLVYTPPNISAVISLTPVFLLMKRKAVKTTFLMEILKDTNPHRTFPQISKYEDLEVSLIFKS